MSFYSGNSKPGAILDDAPATILMLAPSSDYPFLAPPQQSDEIGRLGNYRVLRLLNQGGMAYVFLAEDRDLKRKVALKVMKPEIANDSAAVERFIREARVLASIKHEHVVTVYQVSHKAPTLFLVMELLRGQTLEDLVNCKGVPAPEEILRIALEIACGLDVVHCNGLIHRDLKPNNLWAEEPRQHIKLLDFGLVRSIEDDKKITGSGFVIGTPGYMSPEQARGNALDQRSDLFSLGSVLYFLTSGRDPFEGDGSVGVLTAVVVDNPTHLSELNKNIPRSFGELVMRLLEKKPENRPATADEVIRRLVTIRKTELSHKTEILVCDSDANVNRPCDTTEKIQRSTIRIEKSDEIKERRNQLTLIACMILLGTIMCSLVLYFKKPADEPISKAEIDKESLGNVVLVANLNGANPDFPGKSANSSMPTGSFGILVIDNCDPSMKLKKEEVGQNRLTFVSSDGAKKFRHSTLNVGQSSTNSHLIAVDKNRDNLWVLENEAHRIRCYDSGGKQKLLITTPSTYYAIAVDPESGNVWAISYTPKGGNTVVYSPNGELLESLNQSGTDIVYDGRTKSFWIANPRLTRYSAESRQKTSAIDLLANNVSSLSIDQTDGSIWVATRDLSEKPVFNKVMKFDSEGELLSEIKFDGDWPKKIALNPNDGSVWILRHRKSLEHYDKNGKHLVSIATMAFTVQVDPQSGDLWTVTSDSINRLKASGETVSQLRLPTRTFEAWIEVVEQPRQ